MVGNGERALESFRDADTLDLVILDIELPDIDGITLCQELRRSSDVPIIMLTAREGERNVVVGLEVGADDYVTKPASPAEVVSRVRANLRRRRMDAQAANIKYELRDLVIDVSRRQVWVRGEQVDLTTTEFGILSLLAAHPGWVYSRQQIMQQLWDGDFYGEARSADVHIQRIRKKIESSQESSLHSRPCAVWLQVRRALEVYDPRKDHGHPHISCCELQLNAGDLAPVRGVSPRL